MEPKKLKRSTNAQLSLLIDYMSTHKDFAGSDGDYAGPMGSRKSKEVWEQLQEALNVHGPDKSVEQWKQTWRDVKRKARRESEEMIASSGNKCTISDTMRKVLSTIGYTIIDDDDDEDMVSSKDLKDETCDNVEDHDPLCPTSPIQVSPSTVEPTFQLPSQESSHRYQRVKRRRRRMPPEATNDLNGRSRQNALLQRLCNLVEEQNSILRERNRFERNKTKFSNRHRRL